jgi:hypothetical protein
LLKLVPIQPLFATYYEICRRFYANSTQLWHRDGKFGPAKKFAVVLRQLLLCNSCTKPQQTDRFAIDS